MNAPVAIPFARHPAAHGALWLSRSYRMLRAYPARWLLLLVVFYVIIGAVDYIPWIGPLLHLLLKPVFAVGFLAAAWAQERGGRPEIGELFRGFRANLPVLLGIGLVLVAGGLAAAMVSSLVDGGQFASIMSQQTPVDRDALAVPAVQAGLLVGALAALPLLAATWFAPALVVFQECGTLAAIATSLRAALANWRPIAVYGALVLFYGALVPTLALGIMTMIVPETVQNGIAIAILIPWFAFLMAVLQISDYVSYRDVFHPDLRPLPPDDA